MTSRPKQPALRGDLALLPPEILVQMLSLGRVDGCLRFGTRARRCRVYLRGGRITWAQLEPGARPPSRPATARQRVCEALGEALAWRQGRFTFERGARPRRGGDMLDAEPQELLLECLSNVRGGDEDGRV